MKIMRNFIIFSLLLLVIGCGKQDSQKEVRPTDLEKKFDTNTDEKSEAIDVNNISNQDEMRDISSQGVAK